jgi:hypothetical protein
MAPLSNLDQMRLTFERLPEGSDTVKHVPVRLLGMLDWIGGGRPDRGGQENVDDDNLGTFGAF